MSSYANVLEAAAFQRASDAYFWADEAEARREANVSHQAQWIADEVISPTPDCEHRRAAFIEELVDEGVESFVRDILDDVAAGVDPSETIRRRVRNWALSVAEYEDERDEN
jgi:hypothetical protein